MFGRLAVTILFWGCASAVRLQNSDVLEETINPKASPLPRKVRLAVFTQAQAKVNSTSPIREAIQKAFLRGCLLEVALEREAFYISEGVAWPAFPEGNISTALEAMFEAEDSGTPVSVPMEQVKRMGLKLNAARDFCNNDGGEPLHRVVQECLVDFANRDLTRSRSWFRKGRGEKAIESPNVLLPDWLQERFTIEHALQLMRLSSDDFLRDAQQGNATTDHVHTLYATNLESNKEQIKATGFSVTHTEHHCKNLHKDETKQAEELYMERVGLELARAQSQGGCQEGEQPCPESTSPQHTRAFRIGRALPVYAAAWVISWPAVPLISTWLLGQTAGAAFAAAFFITPGSNELVSLPFAAIAGIPIFGECGCKINPCEWNAEQGVCAFTPSSTSTNEYQWLPYPGTKCAPSENAQEVCMMQVCGPEDFQTVRQDQPFGQLGKDGSATFNCLSDDGTRTGDLGMKEQLPNQLPNTPENRNALYAELNPTKPS